MMQVLPDLNCFKANKNLWHLDKFVCRFYALKCIVPFLLCPNITYFASSPQSVERKNWWHLLSNATHKAEHNNALINKLIQTYSIKTLNFHHQN